MKKIGIRAAIAAPLIVILLQAGAYTLAVAPTSQAQIEFSIDDDQTTQPVDPDNPETETGGTPTSGSFAFVHISDFAFEPLTITSKKQTSKLTTVKPNIQVLDLRGVITGWNVKADLSAFTVGQETTLPGSSIIISDMTTRSQSVSDAPAIASKPVVIPSDGGEIKVISAKQNEGLGLWVMRWYPDAGNDILVNLEVPAGSATVGSHTATVNWILENGP